MKYILDINVRLRKVKVRLMSKARNNSICARRNLVECIRLVLLLSI